MKRTNYALILVGIIGVVTGVIVSPDLATRYFSRDHHITSRGLQELRVYRLLVLGTGLALLVLGTTFLLLGRTPLQAASGLGQMLSDFGHMLGSLGYKPLLVLGSIIRLAHLPFIDITLPYRYGGLFVEFSQQIAAHGYSLPDRIPFYTDGGIPFAYPPLPFYVQAVLVDWLSLPKFSVVTLLPAVVAVLTVPSFWFLTQQLELEVRTRLAALAAFGFMPAAFWDLTEGGGLSEAFGALALIWLAIALVRAYKCDTAANHGLVGVSWASCILASPGSAYASVPTVLISVVAQFARSEWRPGVRIFALWGATGAIAMAMSSPYWATVATRHGIQVFVSSVVGQHGNLLGAIPRTLAKLAHFRVSSYAPYHLLWDMTILAGVVWTLLHRRWAILAWFIVLFSIPRESVWMAPIPAALLAGIGFTEVFRPLLTDLWKSSRLHKPEQSLIAGGAVLLLGMYILVNPFHAIRSAVEEEGLTPQAITAMKWVKENTPAESKFVVLSREQVKEWFPQIARRTGLNLVYGSEWEPEEHNQIKKLNELLDTCRGPICIQLSVAETIGYDEVYLYMHKDLLSELEASGGRDSILELLWENSEVVIGRIPEEERF